MEVGATLFLFVLAALFIFLVIVLSYDVFIAEGYSNGYYNLPNDYYFDPFMPYTDDERILEDYTRKHDNYWFYRITLPSDFVNSPLMDQTYPDIVSPYLKYRAIYQHLNNCWYWGC